MALESFSPSANVAQAGETMVKRVAKVLSERDPENWPNYVQQAKRLLLAMRGPTDSMLAAVERNTLCWQGLSDDWDTMLNQALRDSESIVFQNIVLRTSA